MTALLLVPARQAIQVGEIDSSESIPGLLERLQLRAQITEYNDLCHKKDDINKSSLHFLKIAGTTGSLSLTTGKTEVSQSTVIGKIPKSGMKIFPFPKSRYVTIVVGCPPHGIKKVI